MTAPQQAAIPSGLAGRRGIQLATLVVFVAFLDFFAGLPLISTYATELGASETMAGFIVSIYSITNLPGNVVAGYFLDRFGRRLPITMGLIVTALALAGYAFATSSEMLLAFRALHGFAAAVLTPGAFAMLGDSTETGSRARTMGRSAASIAVAAIVGPATAGILADRIGYEPVFLIAAGLMAATAVIYVLGSRGAGGIVAEPADVEPRATTDPNPVTIPFRLSWLALASIAALSWTIGVGTFTTYVPLHVQELGETSRLSGYAFSMFALTALIMMAGVVGLRGDRYGRLSLISVGLPLFAAGLFVMAATQDMWAIFVGMSVIGLGFGLLLPTATALVADSSGPTRRGLAFGIFYGSYSLGVSIGAIVSGRIAENATGVTGVPYAVAGIVAAACGTLALIAIARGIGAVSREAS